MLTQTASYPSKAAELDTFLANHPVVVTLQPAVHPEQITHTIDATNLPLGSSMPSSGIITFHLRLLPKETPFIIGTGYSCITEITLADHALRYDVLTNETTIHGDSTLLNFLLNLCEHLCRKRSNDFLSHATIRERTRFFEQHALTSNIMLRKHLSPAFLIPDMDYFHNNRTQDDMNGQVLYTGTRSHFHQEEFEIINEVERRLHSTTRIQVTRRYLGVYNETIGTFSCAVDPATAVSDFLPSTIEQGLYTRAVYCVDDSNWASLDKVRQTRCINQTLVTIDQMTRYYPIMPAYLEGERVWSQCIQGTFENDSINPEQPYSIVTTFVSGGKQLFHSHPVKGSFTITYLNAANPSQFTLRIGEFYVDPDMLVRLNTPACNQLDLKLVSRPHATEANTSLVLLEAGLFDAQECLHGMKGSTRVEYRLSAYTAENFFDALIAKNCYDFESVTSCIGSYQGEMLLDTTGPFIKGHPHGPTCQSYYEIQNGVRVHFVIEAIFVLGKKQGPGHVARHYPANDAVGPPLHFKTVIIQDCYFNNDEVATEKMAIFQLWRTSSVPGHDGGIYVKEMQYNPKELLRYDRETRVMQSVGDHRAMLHALRAGERAFKLIYPNLQEVVIGKRQQFTNLRELQHAKNAVAAVKLDSTPDDNEAPPAVPAAAVRTSQSQDRIGQQGARHRILKENLCVQETRYQQQENRHRTLQEQPSTLKKTQSKNIHQILNKLIAETKEKADRSKALFDKVSQDLQQASATKKQNEKDQLTSRAKQRLDEVGLLIQQINTNCSAIETPLKKLSDSVLVTPEVAITETPALPTAAAAMHQPTVPEIKTSTPTTLPPEVMTYCDELRRHYQDCLRLTAQTRDQTMWQDKIEYLEEVLIANAEYTANTDPEAYTASIKAIEKRWKNIASEKNSLERTLRNLEHPPRSVAALGIFSRCVEPEQAPVRRQFGL